MKIKISVKISTEASKIIMKSLEVDNVDLPRDMQINLHSDKESLTLEVEMPIKDPRDVLTLRNTIDEILQHINAIEKTLKEVGKSSS
ncbi:KEOPS complex subunit Pcc1 [Sulfolobus acidocaldarius]|uniref:Uncharacterized protein n=3 Tax=Sulfolobus acidocaldarius TaxID=2285 RepID=A0A0U3FNU1_9CREN|nr:KEOPS complex subunit Pcc1 [Sulfolobus acidocaldarius]AGE70149.1 hypothetical protein SacN8_00840 [Sulfolobus acidocaldarius N8]AGE72424.1 hypothetical protein SacRon12I_00840 [Sulfolobus acidocaldarius Ron12/I]ALU29438.1 hypothetical protein ATY89_05405 [Sulfolobus acidocaldarius]ALU32167.1 hypothetical protein ATZ20_08425 [Sulfolobus acidocaldarius]WCM34170.1 hypothetical protein GO597_01870 [Sulfolobus acidocaldarius DSM 639]